MAKQNKINPKNRPFNGSLFDGISQIIKKQETAKAEAAKVAAVADEEKKQRERRQAAASGYRLDDKRSDEDIWNEFNKDTKRLKENSPARVSVRLGGGLSHSYIDDDADVLAELNGLVSGDVPFALEHSDEYVAGHIPGLDSRTINDLKKGNIPYSDHLDLHGLTAEEAKKNLKRFLIRARQGGQRCVLVVTGRGLNSPDKVPVLRSAFPGWVSSGAIGKIVMAFCTALPTDGGPGAFYVLLRKNGCQPFMPLDKESEEETIEEFAALFGADR